MTKKLAALLLGIALGTTPATAQQPAPAAAAATTDADPALWVVSDKDTTIYLFGTVHVLKPGLSWFDDAVKKAFDKADELVLEINEPDPAAMRPLMMQLGYDTASRLSLALPGNEDTTYLNAMGAVGIPPAAADRFKPWLAATVLSVAPLEKLGYSAKEAPEHVLTAAAKREGKKLGELETAEQQLHYLADLSPAAQRQFLRSALDRLPDAGAEMATMVSDWSKGKPGALGALLNADLTKSPELKKTLLTDRNARWADWVQARLKTPGTVFVAVGAGHLTGGPSSVQADLAAKHIEVTRIAY